jgi:rhodanese-related sulfurtransferase
MVVASTGSNEKTMKKLGREYLTTITHSASHAGYYPGSNQMAVKCVYTKDGQLLGAQIVGFQGVDKRMDVLAVAVRHKMSMYDLTELELSYAPPFSSAKDPVNMAGYAATNVLKGDTATANWDEAMHADMSKTFLLDVREPYEYEAGHITSAVNIPLNELRSRFGELPKDKEVIVNCQVGLRSYIGTRILMQNGFEHVRNLIGGYKTYSQVANDMKARK